MPRISNIQIRRGTTTEWLATNPVLSYGEPGLDVTTNTFKIGDGVKTWSQLVSISGFSNTTEINNVQNTANLYLWSNFR